MIRSEKLCEGNLSMSLLDESNRSDAARSSSIDTGNSDCENFTGGEHQKEVLKLKFGLKMLETSTSRFLAWPVAIAGTQIGAQSVLQIKWVSLLVAVPNGQPHTQIRNQPKTKRKTDNQPKQPNKTEGEKGRKGN